MYSRKARGYETPTADISRHRSYDYISLNKSFGGTSSPGVRKLDFTQTFFQERSPSRSRSIESSPFVGGKKNRVYINPTFRTSGDFQHTLSPEAKRSAKDCSFHERSKSQDLIQASSTGKLRERPAESSLKASSINARERIKKANSDASDNNVFPKKRIENLKVEDIVLANKKSRISSDITPRSEISQPRSQSPTKSRGNALTTTHQESYVNPKSTFSQEIHDFLHPNVVNQTLIEEKNRRKQLEKEQEKGYGQKVKSDHETFKGLSYHHQKQKREVLRGTLEENIRMLREKEAFYKKQLREELSSPMTVDHTEILRDYLQKNIVKSNITEDLTKSGEQWNQRFEGTRSTAKSYNSKKRETDVIAKKSEKRVDQQQERIEKIGRPKAYQERPRSSAPAQELLKTPERSGARTPLSNASSGIKEQSGTELDHYYQYVLSKAYDNYNPEIQKKHEHKLKQIKINQAYKLLANSAQNRRIPYSAVSKLIYEQTPSDIKY